MTLPFPEDLISAYLDGELSAADKARVERALRDDADLQALYGQLQALRTTLRAMPRQQPDQDMTEWVLRQAERRMLSDTTSDPVLPEASDPRPLDSDAATTSAETARRRPTIPGSQSPDKQSTEIRPQKSRLPLEPVRPANRWRWHLVLGTLATTAALLLALVSIPWHGAKKMVADSAANLEEQRAIPAPADDQPIAESAFGINAPTAERPVDAAELDDAARDAEATGPGGMLGARLPKSQPESPMPGGAPVPAGKGARSYGGGETGMKFGGGFGGGSAGGRRKAGAASEQSALMRSKQAPSQPRALRSRVESSPAAPPAAAMMMEQSQTVAKGKTRVANDIANRLDAEGVLVLKVALNRSPSKAQDGGVGGAIAGPGQRVVQLVKSEDGLAIVAPFALASLEDNKPDRAADKPAVPVPALGVLAGGHTVIYAEGSKPHVRALLDRLSHREDMAVSVINSVTADRLLRRQPAIAPSALADAVIHSKRPAAPQRKANEKEDLNRQVTGQSAGVLPSARAPQVASGRPGQAGQLGGGMGDMPAHARGTMPTAVPHSDAGEKKTGLATEGLASEPQAGYGYAQSAPIADPNTAYIVLRVTRPQELPASQSRKN